MKCHLSFNCLNPKIGQNLTILIIFGTRLSVPRKYQSELTLTGYVTMHLQLWAKQLFAGRPAFGVVYRYGGWLANVGYLGTPKVDFSKSRQIAYLVSKKPSYSPKKFRPCSRSVDDCQIPRAARGRFLRNSPNRIFRSQKAYFCAKFFLATMVGW